MPDMTMALPSGAVVALELGGGWPDEMQQVSRGNGASHLAREAFEKGLAAVGELAELVRSQIRESGADEVEMEVGVEFGAGVDVKIVRSDAKSMLRLTLRWKQGVAA
jgi:hypothetical protein